jgi:hypothetical protein
LEYIRGTWQGTWGTFVVLGRVLGVHSGYLRYIRGTWGTFGVLGKVLGGVFGMVLGGVLGMVLGGVLGVYSGYLVRYIRGT